jgi:TusA-related sulfurtransferase
MLRKHFLDAQEMEPPEPFDMAAEILTKMQPGEYLEMLHRRIPYPLFEICKKLSLSHSIEEKEASSYRIVMYFDVDGMALKEEGTL